MKKSKLFMALGAIVLAITGVLATKANKKFAPVSSATFNFLVFPYTGYGYISLPSSHFTTINNLGLNSQVYIGLFTNTVFSTPTILVQTAIKSGISSVYAH